MMIFDASGRAVPLERIYLCQGIEPTQPPPGAKGSFYHCVWCDSGKFNTLMQLEGHINGTKHVKKLKQKLAKFPSRALASGYPQGTSLTDLFDTFRTSVANTNVTSGTAMSSAPSMLVASPAARSNVTADGGSDTSEECLDPPSSSQATRWELYRRCTGAPQADETTWEAIARETCDVPPDDWAWCPSSFLTLRVGDHVSVLGKDGDWNYGTCGYRKGWFKCSTVTPTSNCENI